MRSGILCLFAALSLSVGPAAASSRLAQELPARMAAYKDRMRKAPGTEAKLSVLRELKSYLNAEIAKSAKKATRANRKERFTLLGLSEYLSKIDDHGFTRARCEPTRDAIVFSFSPRENPPTYVPGEAKEALDVLSILCGT